MKIETDLEIDDRVEIIELSRTGCIMSFHHDGKNLSVLVRYFDNGRPETVAFYRSELKKVQPKPTGFEATK